MKKLFKGIAILVGIGVLLLVGAAVALPLFLNPNDYKDDLASAVKEQTGRELSIQGDIDLTVFPWLGLKLGVVELGNAAGFQAPFFARTEEVSIRVKLMPLLDRKVEMDTVTVHGLQLNLERDGDGKGNWEDLQGEGKPTPEKGQGGDDVPIAALAIGGLDIRKAGISWNDASAKQAVQVAGLSLQTGALRPGAPVELKLEFDVDASEPAIQGKISLTTVADVDAGAQRYSAHGISATARLQGNGLPGGKLEADLSADATFDGGAKKLTVDGLKAILRGLQAGGVSADIDLAGAIQGDLAGQRFEVTGLTVKTVVSGDTVPGGKTELSLTSGVIADLGKQTASLSNFAISGAGLDVKGNLQASDIQAKTPKLKGQISVAPFSPRELLAALGQGIDTADPKALAKASLNTTLSGSANAVSLKPLTIELDETSLKGEVSVANFAKPAIRFRLEANGIDADRYLPPGKEGETTPAATPGAAGTQAAGIPVDTLRSLDIDGRVRLGKLKVSGLRVSDIDLTVKAKDGLVKLSPLKAQLYEGRYAGDISLDARGAKPRLSLNERLSGIQAGPLLQDLKGEDRLSGRGDLTLKLTADGEGPDTMKQTLNGDARFAFTNGAVKGVNIARMIREAKARMQGQQLPPEEGELKTDFSSLSGSFQFTDGIADNRDLVAKSPLLRITGEGTADLPKEQVDYRVTTTLVATARGQGGHDLADLAGVPIPVRVTGSFAQPSYGLDMDALIGALAQSKAQAVIEKQTGKVTEQIQKKIGDQIGNQAGDAAKGLLKGFLR